MTEHALSAHGWLSKNPTFEIVSDAVWTLFAVDFASHPSTPPRSSDKWPKSFFARVFILAHPSNDAAYTGWYAAKELNA